MDTTANGAERRVWIVEVTVPAVHPYDHNRLNGLDKLSSTA